MKQAVLLGVALSTLAPGPAEAQVRSVERAPIVDSANGEDLYRARHVLNRFYRTERRPECYQVLFSQFEGNLRVDFVPKNRGRVFYVEGNSLPDGRESCGRNVGYVLDRRGRVIRHIYSR